VREAEAGEGGARRARAVGRAEGEHVERGAFRRGMRVREEHVGEEGGCRRGGVGARGRRCRRGDRAEGEDLPAGLVECAEDIGGGGADHFGCEDDVVDERVVRERDRRREERGVGREAGRELGEKGRGGVLGAGEGQLGGHCCCGGNPTRMRRTGGGWVYEAA
jgi:hypothetical protein